MYRNVPENIFHNVWKCTEKAISKVIWVGKGALDAILSQINKKIGDRFHFQWHRRRLNYQFSNYVTDKVNGSRVQPSLFGEDQRPDPGDRGNRAYELCWHHLTPPIILSLSLFILFLHWTWLCLYCIKGMLHQTIWLPMLSSSLNATVSQQRITDWENTNWHKTVKIRLWL